MMRAIFKYSKANCWSKTYWQFIQIQLRPSLNDMHYQCLRVRLEHVVWIDNTIDNNFGIDNDFTKMFKGDLLMISLGTLLLQLCFNLGNLTKVVSLSLAAVIINGLKEK